MDTYCTSGYTRMDGLFSGKTFYTGDKYIGRWDVSSVTTMDSMFNGALGFNQDITIWDTRNVTDMEQMFDQCTQFEQDLRNWNVGKVTNCDAFADDSTSFLQNHLPNFGIDCNG